jgi:hypothetical protein
MEAASYTSIESPPGIEEWALAGLTKRASALALFSWDREQADDKQDCQASSCRRVRIQHGMQTGALA